MLQFLRFLLILLCAASLGSCSLFSNAVEYRKTSEEFIESAIKEDCDKCVQLFALSRPEAKGVNLDTLKKGIANFRNVVVNELGKEIEYTFLSAVKTYSESDPSAKDLTEVRMELSNKEKFDEVVIVFDDNSKRILNIRTLNLNKPIPPMLGFWLFGVVCLCVPAFNIYMVLRIKRSNRRHKWLKYIALFVVNFPTISYNLAAGIFLKPLFLQMLFGFSFNLGGYQNSKWELGIPLAGLYWLWRLTVKPRVEEKGGEDVDKVSTEVGPLDQVV